MQKALMVAKKQNKIVTHQQVDQPRRQSR